MHAVSRAHAGAARAKVLYSPSELWSLPNVVTLAGIYQAIPLPSVLSAQSQSDSGLAEISQDLPVAFDAHGMWQDAEEATQWAVDTLHGLCNSTASLVVLQVRSYCRVLPKCLAPSNWPLWGACACWLQYQAGLL